MPMIKITFESPVESQVESPSTPPEAESPTIGLKRRKPPPISIPNSNFLNFVENDGKNGSSGNGNINNETTNGSIPNCYEESQNISKDAMSKPDTSSTVRMSIGTRSQCGNYGNLSSHLGKNFVKATI